MKNRRKNRRRNQTIFLAVLGTLIVSMAGYQIYEYLEAKDNADDVEYTAAVFTSPMRQSIEVLMMPNSDDNESVIDNQSAKIEYSDIKNYDEDNLSRYLAYHRENPDLLDADVIWRVNTDLDKPFYTDIKLVEEPQSETVVVNKYNVLSADFLPDDLVITENEYKDFYLTEDTYEAYLELKEALNKNDLNINIASAYRNYNYQSQLYNNYVLEHGVEEADTFSARPGHSGHQLGLVIDVDDGNLDYTEFGKTEASDWIKDNAHRFGFIIRYKADPELTGYQIEPWHLRYVGKDVAVDMYESNIQILEEYLDKRGIE